MVTRTEDILNSFFDEGSGTESNLLSGTSQPTKQDDNFSNNVKSSIIPEVSAASAPPIKLPPFWSRCPQAWFLTIENLFTMRSIQSDSRKFQHVLAALPEDIVMSVLDIVQNPSGGAMYSKLKETLIARHSLSEKHRLDSLFSKTEMGDQKPSEFYRYLELNAGGPDTFNRSLLLKLWMARLPNNISIALVGSGKTDIEEVLPLADRIWEASNTSSVSAMTYGHSSTTSNSNQAIGSDALIKIMTEVSNRFQAMEREIGELRSAVGQQGQFRRNRDTFQQSRERSRYRSPHSSRRFNRSASRKPKGPYCWYHTRHGNNAIRCVQPCSFKDAGAKNE